MVVLMVFHFANLPHKVGDCVGRVGMDKNFCSATAEPLNREPLKLNSYIFISFMPPSTRTTDRGAGGSRNVLCCRLTKSGQKG